MWFSLVPLCCSTPVVSGSLPCHSHPNRHAAADRLWSTVRDGVLHLEVKLAEGARFEHDFNFLPAMCEAGHRRVNGDGGAKGNGSGWIAFTCEESSAFIGDTQPHYRETRRHRR